MKSQIYKLKPQNAYKNYEPGTDLAVSFKDNNLIPLLQMEHLRQLDLPITRKISYERTIDEFCLQLAVNDYLRPLKKHTEMVILLDAQGAIIEEDSNFSLLFTPDKQEQFSLAADAPLYPVLKELLRKERTGEVCRAKIPKRSMRAIVSGVSPFSILDEYCSTYPGGYLSAAEKIVCEGTDELFAHVPLCRYGNLSTADLDEIENYNTIMALFEDYIHQYDIRDSGDSLQPLSVAVFGAPGTGKSYGVRQIASTCRRFSVRSLNLSQYTLPADLFEALATALECDKDEIPLIFFDEFDTELNGQAYGWLKYFLAPMQDGEYSTHGRQHTIRGAVFVFAGGTASSFSEFVHREADDPEGYRKSKAPDFISRLKGMLNIKGPNPVGITDQRHVIRRAMLMRELIEKKTPAIYDPQTGLVNISRGLLSALLRVSEYRHGSRSLEFILAMSRLSEIDRFTPSSLPLDAQLDIHLDVQDFRRKLAFENMMGDVVIRYAQITHEKYCAHRIDEARRLGASENDITLMCEEPEMAAWDELDERFKHNRRSQIRYLGEKLQSYNIDLGLRPVLPEAEDTITELYGPVMEELAQIEHERWVMDKKKSGWRYGEIRNDDLKLTPDLVPYGDLDERTRDKIRAFVRFIPEYLNAIGYELYRKSF